MLNWDSHYRLKARPNGRLGKEPELRGVSGSQTPGGSALTLPSGGKTRFVLRHQGKDWKCLSVQRHTKTVKITEGTRWLRM